jgi:GNAT superfamily N-acetyltransferase
MPTYTLTIEEQPSAATVRFLEDRLSEYNAGQTRRAGGRPLGVLVRDADGHIVAGLNGWTWAGWLGIANLWVREDVRGHRHGSALVYAAEKEATARGCTRAVLDTFSFQAPWFYQRLGYRIVAVVDDFPTGHTRYTMVRRLDALGA